MFFFLLLFFRMQSYGLSVSPAIPKNNGFVVVSALSILAFEINRIGYPSCWQCLKYLIMIIAYFSFFLLFCTVFLLIEVSDV